MTTAPAVTISPESTFGPWHPGLRSPMPRELWPLATIHRPENVLTTLARAEELHDLTGLPLVDIVAFRPERLALHELLVRVTADISVPDGPRIEDLGINFREIVRRILRRHVDPHMPAIVSHYAALRQEIARVVDDELRALFDIPSAQPAAAATSGTFGFLARLVRRRLRVDAHPARLQDRAGLIASWETRDAADAPARQGVYPALSRVVAALFARHGELWGDRDVIAALVTDIACNQAGSEAIGALLDPLIAAAAAAEGYSLLRGQPHPVVMNTKGPSAAGKSTIRPLQRTLASYIGVSWSDFALISPDIWRKQLIDYGSLGEHYKYGGACTGDELAIIDQKLDRYMARKASEGIVPHLLIDRFRFDSFAPDSDEAGSNLLTRFGHVVYLFVLVTPPESLVERAWNRGLEVGRYKSVDDVLAHGVEAYAGIPGLFFTWIKRQDKRVHFEFLDNSVRQGERPRTAAFGWNETLNVLDVGCMLDIERFRRVDTSATAPDGLYRDQTLLAPERNSAFLRECIRRFGEVNFADRASGRIYLRIRDGDPLWIDAPVLAGAAANPDTRAALEAIDRTIFGGALPAPDRPTFIVAAERIHTVGEWGLDARTMDVMRV